MASKLRYLRWFALIAVLALIMGQVSTGAAQDDPDSVPQRERPSVTDLMNGAGNPITDHNLRGPNGVTGTVTLLVEFEGQAAAAVYGERLAGGASPAEANAAAQEAGSSNMATQQRLRASLNALGAVELYSVQRVLNASVIRVDASKIEQIMAMPGVVRVSLAPRHTLDNSTSIPYINANNVWDSTGALGVEGLTGSGISVAIIDTGIDYLHLNFGGDATYVDQTDVTVLTDTGGFPQGKVIAGWDLVGDAYDASDPLNDTPIPDDDPTDCNGHGSHVAGTAAGYGVDAGATYAGGYDDLTDGDLSAFEIGPGVAPEADLVAIKVFGCDGSTDVVIQAIELAMDPNGDMNFSDHYDVINMSLGSDYGFLGEETAIANAVAAGVIVVAASGNAGDVHYITGTPAGATEAISVAGVQDSGLTAASVDDTVNAVSYVAIPAAFGPALTTLTPAVPAPFEEPSGNLNACLPADFTGFTAGNVALVDRGACNFTVKVKNAQDAGASAVVVVNVSTNVPFVMGGDDLTITIPSVMISGDAGILLRADLPTSGQLNPAGPSQGDIVYESSSRGPRRDNLYGTMLLKPDITAPAVAITSTLTGYDDPSAVGDESLTISGTSMATPHVAGVMALLAEQHPTWTVEQLKALAMSTANHDVYSLDLVTGAPGVRQATSRSGAGRVDPEMAAADEVFAYDADLPAAVSVAFQTRDVMQGTVDTEDQVVEIYNASATSVTFTPSIDTVTDATGVAFSVPPGQINVPAMSSATVTVTATYTASSMAHDLDPTMFDIQGGEIRWWITEETGYLVLNADAGTATDLRVALYAAPRPASDMTHVPHDDGKRYLGPETGAINIPLAGTDVENLGGSTPSGVSQRYRSRVSAFNWLFTSPEIDANPNNWDGGDLEHIGVESDVLQVVALDPITNDPIYGHSSFFGISTYGEWDTPLMRETYVCLDLDQDGAGGVWTDGTDFCYVTQTNAETDVHMTGLWDINGFLGFGQGAFFTGWDYQNGFDDIGTFETRLMNNSVMLLPAETSPAFWAGTNMTSGAEDAAEAFDFYIFVYDYNDPVALSGAAATDGTPLLTFDPESAPFDAVSINTGPFGAFIPLIRDFPGTFNFNYDLSAEGDREAELLFLHHYNMEADRAQVLTLVVGSIFDDVPVATKEFMQPWIEYFYSIGLTSGCAQTPLSYCPERPVTRAEMAVFILRAINYPALPHTPPAESGTFDDVPVPTKEWMEPWIEEFFDLGITNGCSISPPLYCPEREVTRAEMAVFILRALEGGAYQPPAASGTFDDMPVATKEWMEPWVEEFYARGITTGCNQAPLQFCPEQAVTRAEMAVFILRAFDNLNTPWLP